MEGQAKNELSLDGLFNIIESGVKHHNPNPKSHGQC
jgi:hypothetical protein